MRVLFLFFFSFLVSIVAEGQEGDTTVVDSNEHDPAEASLRSALLPGLGQIYNEKYWKLPIVYGGLGASVYFIDRNTSRYKRFKNALIARNDPDKSDPYVGIYNEQQLTTLKETYRRWRDMSYMSLIAIYVLQIVDANVDAHLHDFDVSDDLSLRIRPWTGDRVRQLPSLGSNAGVSLSLNF